jgi:hypothetical protein
MKMIDPGRRTRRIAGAVWPACSTFATYAAKAAGWSCVASAIPHHYGRRSGSPRTAGNCTCPLLPVMQSRRQSHIGRTGVFVCPA